MARFWVGGGSSTNWNATSNTNWAASSGGAGNQTVPDNTQDVTFDGAGSGNGASVISANITVLSLTFTSGYTNTITINTTVTLTIAGNFTDNTAHSWTVNGTGAMTISAASSINSGGKTFPGPVAFSGANTKTLVTNNWTISGALTISTASTVINWTTAETLSCAGLTMSNSLATGTSKIILTGGTWSGAGAVINNIDIQGNVTISGSVTFNTKTLTYVSGTVTTTSSTIQIGASSTLDTNGISFNNITITATATLTLNSLLTATGTFTGGAVNLTMAGAFGFTVGTLSCTSTGAVTWTFVNNITYTVTTSLDFHTTRTGSIMVVTSDHASNKANLTLNNGATCNVLASFTRIDASGGRAILSFNGTITTCTNVFAYTNVAVTPSILIRKFGRRNKIYDRATQVVYQIP